MEAPLLLLSENAKDIDFWPPLARAANLSLTQTVDEKVGASFLEKHPDAIVLWDTNDARVSAIGPIVRAKARLTHTFSISDGPFKDQSELFSPPLFAHHLFRRYEGPASRVYEKLILHLAKGAHLTLHDLFPKILHEYSETITQSSQRLPAVEAVSQFFTEAKILERIATTGANAADELLMNAIFDAPWTKELGHYRRPVDRSDEFAFSARERVELKAVIGPELIGLSVADQFGSIDIQKFVRFLGLNFESREYKIPTTDPGAGLGIYKIHKASMTLLILLEPGLRTEAIVLLGNAPSFREFKLGFSFFSVLLNQAGSKTRPTPTG